MENLENQTTTTEEKSEQNASATPKSNKNIFGLLGFIGYFVVVFFALLFYITGIDGIQFFAMMLLVAALVLSIIGFVKRNKYETKELTVAGFALNVNASAIIFLAFLSTLGS